jgi:hypothetical protein
MPTYACLTYYEGDADWTAPENAEQMGEYAAFGTKAEAIIRGGAALFPSTTATTVTVKGGAGGELVASDGPYAEAKEVLGGFYLLECDNLDEAVQWAAQIPAAWHGKVEVRPVIPL